MCIIVENMCSTYTEIDYYFFNMNPFLRFMMYFCYSIYEIYVHFYGLKCDLY